MVDFFTGLGEPTGLRGIAASLNLRHIEGEVDRQYWVDNPGGIPQLPLFKNGDTSKPRNIMYGQFGGLDIQAFDFEAIAYPDDPGNDWRSCIIFMIPGNFATLTIGPHTRLSRLQEKSNNPFTQRFRVLGRDPEVAALVLDDPMKQWLLSLHDGLRIELSGAALMGHVPQTDPEQIVVILQQLYGVYLRIPDAAWNRYGTGFAV